MPPAAISRSSTYLPKSWGYIWRDNGSALWAILLLSGCAPDQDPDRILRVQAHLPAAHAAGTGGLSIELTALGDFEGSNATSKIAPGDARGLALPFPAQTRAVSARASGGAKRFIGIGSAAPGGNIDVLLWRSGEASELSGADFPAEPLGVSLGVDAGQRTLLAAGSRVASADASRAYTVDLATGVAQEVPDGMLPARAFATVTPFGPSAMLVAGGVDPTLSGGDLASAPAIASASVFHQDEGRFDRSRLIALAQPRSRHAAVVLESGETLLIGGSGPNGVPLSTLEVVSPEDSSARIAGLATLESARELPRALRLTDGSVFVGGGTLGGSPVGVLEWLSPDAKALTFLQGDLVLAESHSFAAMPDGGVLSVGVCVPKTVQACAGDAAKRSVIWFRRGGAFDVLPPLTFTPSSAALVAAGAGAPWLYATVGPITTFRYFDPWTGRFEEPAERPEQGPDPDLPAPIGVDPGAFVWLERAGVGALRGFRHDVRGVFARDLAPLLLAGREHMAPNKFPSGVSKSGVEYSAGGLGLAGVESRAVVADTTYADVDLAITMTSGAPPVVELGGARVGGGECPWPDTTASEPGEVLRVQRRAETATLERRGHTRSCAVVSGRISVSLAAAGGGKTFVRALEIRRR
ncbi:MAG: hypothetical protein HYZ29_26140 [Myxococcales bacterium]|nr:hypothetical protein [Myxococcales bacterium]